MANMLNAHSGTILILEVFMKSKQTCIAFCFCQLPLAYASILIKVNKIFLNQIYFFYSKADKHIHDLACLFGLTHVLHLILCSLEVVWYVLLQIPFSTVPPETKTHSANHLAWWDHCNLKYLKYLVTFVKISKFRLPLKYTDNFL